MPNKRLLVIDNQPTIRWALRNYFESRGYEVAEAESEAEALVQVQRFHPDALAMDCHLPNEDGNLLIEQVKSVVADVPVVIIASYGSVDRAVQATHSGPPDQASADLPLVEVEKKHIQAVLRNNRGNIEKAAAVLGISRSSLYERVKRYGIQSS
jgi:DNA-binding NtrC family response regulator